MTAFKQLPEGKQALSKSSGVRVATCSVKDAQHTCALGRSFSSDPHCKRALHNSASLVLVKTFHTDACKVGGRGGVDDHGKSSRYVVERNSHQAAGHQPLGSTWVQCGLAMDCSIQTLHVSG